jgi:hypothetical protein
MNRCFPVISPESCRILAFALLMLVPNCRRLEERMQIKESRPISTYAAAPSPIKNSEERFANAEPEESPENAPMPRQNLFAWVTPEGWSEAGEDPAGMRFINLKFGPNGEGECYLSLMPGSAGGVDANINRWRSGQMGLPALSKDDIEKLPKKPLLNREATFVTLDGDYKNVGAQAALKGYRLVGLILAAPQATLFVKMTGPKDLVEKNMPAFEEFVSSISPAR